MAIIDMTSKLEEEDNNESILNNSTCDASIVKYLIKQLKVEQAWGRKLTKNIQDFLSNIKIRRTLKQANCPPIIPRSHKPRRYPASCAEAVRVTGLRNQPHMLHVPEFDLKPFYVYCIDDPFGNGSAWTVILRRLNGKIDFYRTYEEYQSGFGAISREYWIGLDALHALTHYQIHELWIQLHNFEDEERYARYSHFAVHNEIRGYDLNLLGSYSGDAGESLLYHAGCKFSTHDRGPSVCCAKTRKGAWWYKNCIKSHLTGQYAEPEKRKDLWEGIMWNSWPGLDIPLKNAIMAIRPREQSSA